MIMHFTPFAKKLKMQLMQYVLPHLYFFSQTYKFNAYTQSTQGTYLVPKYKMHRSSLALILIKAIHSFRPLRVGAPNYRRSQNTCHFNAHENEMLKSLSVCEYTPAHMHA